jgi:hypothetical protein
MNPLAFPVQFLLCLAVDAFLVIAWFVWVSVKAAGRASLTVRLLTAATLFWAQLALVGLVLGIVGFFTRPSAIVLNLGVPAALFYLCRRSILPILRDGIVNIRALLRRPRGAAEWAMSAVVVLAGMLVGWFALLAIYFPVSGYDDYAVHLPVVGFVIQSKALAIVPLPVGLQMPINSFSQLGELFALWHYAIVGSGVLINVWQIGIILQLLLAAFVLCRALGCARLVSLFASSLICFTPTVLFQILTAYSDVAVAAFFATGLAFGMRPLQRLGWLQPLGVGLACGLLLAAQMSAPLLVAAIVANFVAHSIEEHNWRKTAYALLRPLALIVLVAAVIGSYWYVRNTVVFGNPVYPFARKAAGHSIPIIVLFQNLQLAAMPYYQRVLAPWVETRAVAGTDLYSLDSTWAGFGPIWFVLGVPSIVAAIVATLTKRRWDAAAMLLIGVTAFLLFPGNFIVRFSLFVLPLMSAAVGWVLEELSANQLYAPTGWNGIIYRLPALLLPVLGMVLAVLTVGLIIPATRAPAAVIRQIVSPVAKTDLPESYLYKVRAVTHAIPRSAVVAFDETIEFISPLWRDDYANQVHFVPTTGTWDDWRSRMQALHATYVFATHVTARVGTHEDVSNLRAWIGAHPEAFRLVAATPAGDLYELFFGHTTP